jgi:beta-lactamase class A
MMKLSQKLSLILLFMTIESASAQTLQTLKDKIITISQATKGRVGVALMNIETQERLVVNENEHFAMQSVYKFPLAMAVLQQIDKGKLRLDQKVYVTKKDLRSGTWSPLQKKYPNGELYITLQELLTYTVSESDNNGCDILFRLLGGPQKVQDYILKLGIKDMAIVGTELEMEAGWNVQYTNYSTPEAMLALLSKFNKKGTLSSQSYDFLNKTMTGSPTGPKRLKYLLPKGTTIAHKTGTGPRNKDGVVGSINDVGIVTLPNGQHVAIVVFVSNAKESDTVLENIIAKISKATFVYFQK